MRFLSEYVREKLVLRSEALSANRWCKPGRLASIAIDNLQCFEGGDPAMAWVDMAHQDYWPRPGSPLLGKAEEPLLLRRSISTTENAAVPLTWVPMKPRGNRRTRIGPFIQISNDNQFWRYIAFPLG
jgi:hypothetical protein